MILCTFDTPGEEALLIIRIWHTHTHTPDSVERSPQKFQLDMMTPG